MSACDVIIPCFDFLITSKTFSCTQPLKCSKGHCATHFTLKIWHKLKPYKHTHKHTPTHPRSHPPTRTHTQNTKASQGFANLLFSLCTKRIWQGRDSFFLCQNCIKNICDFNALIWLRKQSYFSLILTVAKFTALLIFLASREECGLAQWMREKGKGSDYFISLHVLYLSWTDSTEMSYAQISVCGVALQHTCTSLDDELPPNLCCNRAYLSEISESRGCQREAGISKYQLGCCLNTPQWLVMISGVREKKCWVAQSWQKLKDKFLKVKYLPDFAIQG